MKTKKLTKKQIVQEKAKVYLFNILYGFRFEVTEFNEQTKLLDWNGTTLAGHIEYSKDGQIIKSALESIRTETVYIYGLVRRVSANGMNRQISFFAIDSKRRPSLPPEIVNITNYVNQILEGKDAPLNSYNEPVIKVTGAGMDMVFHVIYNLSSRLFVNVHEDLKQSDKGYILKQRNL